MSGTPCTVEDLERTIRKRVCVVSAGCIVISRLIDCELAEVDWRQDSLADVDIPLRDVLTSDRPATFHVRMRRNILGLAAKVSQIMAQCISHVSIDYNRSKNYLS